MLQLFVPKTMKRKSMVGKHILSSVLKMIVVLFQYEIMVTMIPEKSQNQVR